MASSTRRKPVSLKPLVDDSSVDRALAMNSGSQTYEAFIESFDTFRPELDALESFPVHMDASRVPSAACEGNKGVVAAAVRLSTPAVPLPLPTPLVLAGTHDAPPWDLEQSLFKQVQVEEVAPVESFVSELEDVADAVEIYAPNDSEQPVFTSTPFLVHTFCTVANYYFIHLVRLVHGWAKRRFPTLSMVTWALATMKTATMTRRRILSM
jgi:hypothetical protein